MFSHLRKGKKEKNFIQSSGIKIIAGFIFFSWSLHILSLVSLPSMDSVRSRKAANSSAKKPVKIKIVSKKSETNSKIPKIVEVLQEETKKIPPKKISRAGYTNHSTLKETKLAKNNYTKGLDPAKSQKQSNSNDMNNGGAKKSASSDAVTNSNKYSPKLLFAEGPSWAPKKRKARNNYESFLNNSLANMGSQVEKGYQDYIEDDLDIGDAIDLNTQEYRFIGYFTSLRKAIELAWTYPSYAVRKGLYGNVFLKFTINKKGRVSKIMVLNSSGHSILDHAVVDAVQLAAPFAPLPQGFGKNLKIKGTFRYVRN